MLPELLLRAPCKINWSLYVTGKRPDGFHDILTLMQCVGLYDTLYFSPSETLELVSDMELPREQNLVLKAALALGEYTGREFGAKIVLKKEIPTGAGLGGGSSDAACALKGLNTLWSLGLEKEELEALGGGLGSDVPFFFECPAALAEGRGEVLTALGAGPAYTLLIIKPDISVSTAWAYEELHAPARGPALRELTKKADKINNIKLIWDALNKKVPVMFAPFLYNEFEEVVRIKYPVVARLKEQLLEAGASAALMSGSGSAVFGVFQTREAAVKASSAFSSYWHRVAETLTGGAGC